MSEQQGYAAGSLRVLQRPDEIVATLTRLEFRVICDGDTSSIKTLRDMFLGFFVSAVIGLLSIWVSANQQNLEMPTIAKIVFATMILVSIILALAFQLQMQTKVSSSAYAELMRALKTHFQTPGLTSQTVAMKNPFREREKLMGRYVTPEMLIDDMNDPVKKDVVQAYLKGAYDLTQESGRSCALLGTTTPKQLEQIYSDYLTAHPLLLNMKYTAAAVAAEAFAEHWPCGK